uniref:Uncharacterized protein n=1 Tax=Romanomermis culicivorax TaxID=13658 RepID=A0A915KRF0_ROMCU
MTDIDIPARQEPRGGETRWLVKAFKRSKSAVQTTLVHLHQPTFFNNRQLITLFEKRRHLSKFSDKNFYAHYRSSVSCLFVI